MAAPTGRQAAALIAASDVARRRLSTRTSKGWFWLSAHLGTDGVLVLVSFVAAYWLRYRLEFGGEVPPGSTQPFGFFAGKVALLVIATLVIFQLRGLYRLPRWTSFLDEVSIVANGSTIAMALVILYSFLDRFYPSRLIFILAWALMIALLAGKRYVTQSARQVLWRRGIGVDRLLVVGAGPAGQRIMQYIYNQPQLGYRVVGFVDSVPADEHWGIATERRVERPQYLGDLYAVRAVVQDQHVNEVIIALPPTAHREVLRIIEQCRERDVDFTLVPDLFELALDHVRINEVAGLALIEIKDARISGWNYAVKRAMDIGIAAFVLSIGALPMLIIAIAIKLDSAGPILFGQERVGKDGRPFVLYKFRSMCRDAEQRKAELLGGQGKDALLFKLRDDPRVTRVGRVLRRTSLDELPQFFNVLVGDMSVVGPRPQVPSEVAAYEEWHYHRLKVAPGLTGLWQVNGRSDLSFDEMVKLDLYYAEHWSPWLDIKLILRTIPAVILARGAY
ncbi:MAG TPA: undecaprenyl-phosphate glucose phosphotransferase [Thermomicrobiaceae bacterium]|nr:undecaprenyl-phosphate glucose phosphotransferase [Thermomicrobiaceae bacterium]